MKDVAEDSDVSPTYEEEKDDGPLKGSGESTEYRLDMNPFLRTELLEDLEELLDDDRNRVFNLLCLELEEREAKVSEPDSSKELGKVLDPDPNKKGSRDFLNGLLELLEGTGGGV